jgi:hypothetical protein
MNKAALIAASITVLFFCWEIPSPAMAQFNPLDEVDFWSSEELPLPVYFWDNGNSGLDGVTGLSLDGHSALQASANTWNEANVNSLGFSFMGTTQTYQPNAVNVSFGELEGPFSDAVGMALIDYNVDFNNPHLPECLWKATGADVVLNQNYSFTTELGPGSESHLDVQSVMTHELGHVLGLSHFDSQPSVMNSFVNRLRDLQLVDYELLANESLFENPICPLTSAGGMEWSLTANSDAGHASITNALDRDQLVGNLPQTVVPGLFDPKPVGDVQLASDEELGLDELVISLEEGYLADGSSSIEFGVSIDNLTWIDGMERELIGMNESGQISLEVEFTLLETSGLNDPVQYLETAEFLASVSFDGSNLEILPLSYEFENSLFLDLSALEGNGLQEIRISGIRFGIASVPEPSSIVILAILGFAASCRRSKTHVLSK